MAAGDYVSVFSQANSEEAELALECTEFKTDVKGEGKELVSVQKPWPSHSGIETEDYETSK